MLYFWVLLLGSLQTAAGTPFPVRDSYLGNGTNQSMVFDFAQIKPSADLKWTPCFENFTCANLEVPLDYDDPSIGTTNIAFMKLAAATQPAKGDILVNPGGPAHSGAAPTFPPSLIPLLGTSWNIVGMDTRGVNNSGPAINCFPDSYSRDFYTNYMGISTLDAADPASRRNFWVTAGSLGEWCSKTLNETAKYVNTPAIAQDMLQYAEKLAESEGQDPKEAVVNYYGLSYGTVLGPTFASLFPDRVGRFIINGVVDGEGYYSGEWLDGLEQADESLEYFFNSCFEAGPLCGFFRNDSSPAALQKRFDAILADLEKNPIPVADPKLVEYPTWIGHIDVRSQVLTLLYDFLAGFPVLGALLSSLEHRNATLSISLQESSGATKGLIPRDSTYVPEYEAVLTRMAITCNDQNGRYNISSPEEFDEYAKKHIEVSKYMGQVWAGIVTINCWNWQIKPDANQIFPGFKETKTNEPILLLGNTFDPVSSSQDKMSSFFPGSRVLLQDAVGHGVTIAPSNCTSGYVQSFLETGELPPPDTICPIDTAPFVPQG